MNAIAKTLAHLRMLPEYKQTDGVGNALSAAAGMLNLANHARNRKERNRRLHMAAAEMERAISLKGEPR